MSKIIYMHSTLQYFDLKGVVIMPDHDDEVTQNETYVKLEKLKK